MPQMTPGQARVIDPVLSNHAKQYQNEELVLGSLFPSVPVTARGGQIIKFGRESFRRANTRRAPGAVTKRQQIGYAADTFALHQDSMEGIVPMELQAEAQVVPGIDLSAISVSSVMESMMITIEYERAKLATDAANYPTDNKVTLSGSDRWSDPAADILDQIVEARKAIRSATGHYPTVLTLSPTAFEFAKKNNGVSENFKYTSSKSVTAEMLAEYFGVKKVIVPLAVSLPEDAPLTQKPDDVWGNHVQLAFVPQSVQGLHVPSFGYTYQLDGYPMVEPPYYERNIKSWVYPTTIEERAYLTSAEAGYLFSSVVA